MTTRSIIQYGQGYGATPVSVTAKINGATIFSGVVNTQNIPIPLNPTPADGAVVLFSWGADTSFNGTQTIEVTPTGGDLLLSITEGNYATKIVSRTDYSYTPDTGPDLLGSTGATEYGFIYQNNDISDPYSNVVIDGRTYDAPHPPNGQYTWKILSGETLTATISIQDGLAFPSWQSNVAYNYKDILTSDYQTYYRCISQAGALAGTPLTDQTVWQTIAPK